MQPMQMEQILSIPERQALIHRLACFSFYSEKDTADLAVLFHEVHYHAGDVIVIEDALVDSVYIIVNGLAEVTHATIKKSKIIKKTKVTHTVLAVLHPGEAIGLNDTGFYSTTGKRTATVTAQTDMLLLVLDIKQLHQFFQKHPSLPQEMDLIAEKMLRMRLIKQSLPFSHLSDQRIEWLANHIEQTKINAGDILFSQGEMGDRCYLIRAGQVEIIAKEEDGTEHQLAVLKPPTLFGEATLITHSPRNATARALTESELFVLRFSYLSELIETENNVADMFMTLMVDRSRPIQNSNITAHPRVTSDGQEMVILKNPSNGKYFKLSAEGWFIWQQLDGKQTMQEITLALAEQYKTFSPDVVAALISKLASAGYIHNIEVHDPMDVAKKPIWVRAMLMMRKILEARVAIGDADKWLSNVYQKSVRYLFTKAGKILLLLFALCGMIAFGFATPQVIHLFKTIHSTWFIIFLLIPFTLLSVALHELGHAFATKSYGYEVHYMGVGWYWLSPVAFTDTSDMWLGTRGPRTVVNIAGICTDLLTAGLAAILIFIIHHTYVDCFLWLFALYTYINAFRMLSPLQDMDGYYILMDLFDKPKLRQSAVVWLIKDFPKALRHPALFRTHKAEVAYWLACILFLILVSVLTLLIQSVIFKILGLHAANPIVSLALPFLVVVMSSLGIIADIRNQAEK